MTISVRCTNPDCGKMCRAKDEYAGRWVKCPGCGQRIAVSTGQSAPASSESADLPLPRIETPVGRKSTPQREQQPPKRPSSAEKNTEPTMRPAIWPWLVAMTVMLLVGIGGGFFFASLQSKKSEERPAQTDPRTSELATASVNLTKQLAAAEEKVQEALAANADLKKRLALAEEKR